MTLEEFEKKLSEVADLHAELKAQFDELKAQNKEKPKPPYPRWMPKEKQIYYTVLYSCGKIDMLNWSSEYAAHKDRFRMGNVYKTRAEAEFVAERSKVLAEMKEWSGNNHYGVYIYYHKPSDQIMMDWDGNSNYFHGDIRFNSVDDVLNCIEAVGKERIKKYYFMIPEES